MWHFVRFMEDHRAANSSALLRSTGPRDPSADPRGARSSAADASIRQAESITPPRLGLRSKFPAFIQKEERRGLALASQVQNDPALQPLLAAEPNLLRRVMCADPLPTDAVSKAPRQGGTLRR